MRTYTVQRGDTLYGISKQFGVSVSEIKRLNNLTSDAITVGDVLQIPTTGNTTYTVQRGDSLYSIARLYNTTVDAIKQFNGLTSDLLSIGMVLRIPALDGNDSSGYVNYTVKKGDSLYSIAKSFDTTVSEIMSFNNLSSTVLSIGQVLKIPTMETGQNYGVYLVQKGDTLYSIANQYGITVSELKALNHLTSDQLSIGMMLKVPGTGVILECYGTNYTEPTYITHTVVKGDNLYSLASRYGVSVDSIKRLNNLTSNLLSIGQVLKIKEA